MEENPRLFLPPSTPLREGPGRPEKEERPSGSLLLFRRPGPTFRLGRCSTGLGWRPGGLSCRSSRFSGSRLGPTRGPCRRCCSLRIAWGGGALCARCGGRGLLLPHPNLQVFNFRKPENGGLLQIQQTFVLQDLHPFQARQHGAVPLHRIGRFKTGMDGHRDYPSVRRLINPSR